MKHKAQHATCLLSASRRFSGPFGLSHSLFSDHANGTFDLQELYAEWVGVEAKVALLEGLAICVAHLQASPDAASLDIVSRAQASHSGYAAIFPDALPSLGQACLSILSIPGCERSATKV